MKLIIGIGGEPATGKSTLMRKLLSKLSLSSEVVAYKKIFKYHTDGFIHVAGIYSDDAHSFSGTDRLAMNVQPEATEFVQNEDGILIFEGDRLFNSSFMTACTEACPNTHAFVLRVSQSIINQRHIDRNDTQDQKFLKSRKTKIENIISSYAMSEHGLELCNNETESDQSKILDEISLLISKVDV